MSIKEPCVTQGWNQDPLALASVFSAVGRGFCCGGQSKSWAFPEWQLQRSWHGTRRGGWLLAGFHFPSSFPTRRQVPCSLLMSGISVAWCSEKVVPFFSVSLSGKTSSWGELRNQSSSDTLFHACWGGCGLTGQRSRPWWGCCSCLCVVTPLCMGAGWKLES